jgi:hypothetical protein
MSRMSRRWNKSPHLRLGVSRAQAFQAATDPAPIQLVEVSARLSGSRAVPGRRPAGGEDWRGVPSGGQPKSPGPGTRAPFPTQAGSSRAKGCPLSDPGFRRRRPAEGGRGDFYAEDSSRADRDWMRRRVSAVCRSCCLTALRIAAISSGRGRGRPALSAYYLMCRSAYDLTCRSVSAS